MNKQIEEMASIINEEPFLGGLLGVEQRVAERLYAAGYRKQSEGEWVEDGYSDIPCVCSHCGAEANYTSTFKETFDYDWEENLQPTGYEEVREYIKTPFCPNCGAKMKGGDEE